MSSEFFAKTFLHWARLKYLWMDKIACRNFITTPNVTSLLIMHAGMHLDESEIYNYNEFNFQMIVIFNSLLESWGAPLTWLNCKSMVLKGLKILHFKANHHNMPSIQLVLKMHSFSLQLHSSLPHQQQYSPPKKSKTTALAPPPQVTDPGPSIVPQLRTRLPLEPSAHHFCFSIDLRSISNLEVSSPVNCYLRWVKAGCSLTETLEVDFQKSFIFFSWLVMPF